jgi:hypothetical protein
LALPSDLAGELDELSALHPHHAKVSSVADWGWGRAKIHVNSAQ